MKPSVIKDGQIRGRIIRVDPARLRLVGSWALLIVFFSTLLFLTQFGLNMRDNTYDLLLNVKAYLLPPDRLPADSQIVIVAIDNYTLSSSAMAVPELFQHRYYTSVVKALNRAGAKSVALNRLLPRSIDDYSTPEDVKNWLDSVSQMDMPVLSGLIWRPNQMVLPDIEYLAAMKISTFGFLNLSLDGDALIRRVSLHQPDCGDALGCYSLSWLAARTLSPGLKLPGDEILLDFDPRPDAFPIISFLDVYRQSSSAFPDVEMSDERRKFFEVFKDKLVLIGEINYLNEGSWPTPLSGRTGYGDTLVEVTAQTVDALLEGRYFRSMGPVVSFVFLYVLTFIAMVPLLLSPRQGPYPGLWLPLALIPVYVMSGMYVFLNHLYLPVLPGVMVLIMSQIFCQTVRTAESRETTRASLTALGLYVNPALAKEVVAHPELLSRTGERKEMTVFFSDLVGFTALAEHTSPEDLVVSLNRYFECMEPIISRSGGILDKFDGDSIMAFWGSPLLPRFDHAASGCLAALDQQLALRALNQRLIAEGRHPLITLMGLTTGPMIAGNIGTQRRLNYTVMGDSVNLASRLVPANKIYHTQIIISEKTAREAARSVELRTLDKVTVSGRRENLTIFEVMAHKGLLTDKQRWGRGFFEKALRLYFNREFQKALGFFEEALTFLPADGPAELMCIRCRKYIDEPPDDEWQGVTALKVK